VNWDIIFLLTKTKVVGIAYRKVANGSYPLVNDIFDRKKGD
jgi:hypothetical protein